MIGRLRAWPIKRCASPCRPGKRPLWPLFRLCKRHSSTAHKYLKHTCRLDCLGRNRGGGLLLVVGPQDGARARWYEVRPHRHLRVQGSASARGGRCTELDQDIAIQCTEMPPPHAVVPASRAAQGMSCLGRRRVRALLKEWGRGRQPRYAPFFDFHSEICLQTKLTVAPQGTAGEGSSMSPQAAYVWLAGNVPMGDVRGCNGPVGPRGNGIVPWLCYGLGGPSRVQLEECIIVKIFFLVLGCHLLPKMAPSRIRCQKLHNHPGTSAQHWH